ncbi:Rieske (2Fe-2S) protein [Actinophytocola sediminis]
MTAVENPTTSTRSRRDMLCGLTVALVAPGALIAACGSGDSGGDGSPGGDNQSTGTGTPGGGGTPLADIPDGGGLLVDAPSGKALLVRNGNEVKAFNASCTHQGTIVSAPKDGVAECPSHGSQFKMSDGSPAKGPATSPLAELTVTVDGDQVTFA